MTQVTLEDVRAARHTVGKIVHQTPLLTSRQLSALCGVTVYLKAENLQRTGSFKVRGAVNKMASMTPEQRSRGVIAASAGNHAQGVALAAREFGVRCTVVMPQAASIAKVAATRGYGAEVVLHGESFDQALEHAHRLSAEQGKTFVHGFDDPAIIAGQGTLGLEICEALPNPGTILVPVGGGGLASGVALAVKSLAPNTRVVGVQAAAAPAAAISWRQRHLVTVPAGSTLADGIAVGRLGDLPWAMLQQYLDDIVTVSEEAIAHAQVLLLERTKLLVEGAGAVGIAALLQGATTIATDSAVVVLSGGNVDMNLVSRIVGHGLAESGRYQALEVVLADRPGRLATVLGLIAHAEANVVDVRHLRHATDLDLRQVRVQITMETRDAEHGEQVARALTDAGYLRMGGPMRQPHVHYFAEADALGGAGQQRLA